MKHYQVYLESKKKAELIAYFIFILSGISLVVTFNPLRLINLIIVGGTAIKLIDGRNWAKYLIIAISVISIFQTIISIGLNADQIVFVVVNIVLMISFGLIAYTLGVSKNFDSYTELRENGVDIRQEDKLDFRDIVDLRKVILVEFKKITNVDAYTDIVNKFLDNSGIVVEIEGVNISTGSIDIETKENIYELSYNNKINVFDREVVKKLNNLIRQLGVEKEWTRVFPESILEKNDNLIHYALLETEEIKELNRLGYVKEDN